MFSDRVNPREGAAKAESSKSGDAKAGNGSKAKEATQGELTKFMFDFNKCTDSHEAFNKPLPESNPSRKQVHSERPSETQSSIPECIETQSNGTTLSNCKDSGADMTQSALQLNSQVTARVKE